MAVKPHGLANRPGEPYPATFLISVDPPRIELGFPPRQGGVVPLDHEPIKLQWTGRGIEPRSPRCKRGIFPLDEPPILSAEVRLGIEPSLPPYQSGVQPQHLQTKVISQCSDPGWNRTITFLRVMQVSSPLDHGIKLSVTEVGVEPTGTRLSTSSLCQFAYPVMCQ